MNPPDSSDDPKKLLKSLRAEIAVRKATLTTGEEKPSSAHVAGGNVSKPKTSPLKKAAKALARAGRRLRVAEKWPKLLRDFRFSQYATGQALIESLGEVIAETERLQKTLATLDGRYGRLALEHALLVNGLQDGQRAVEELRILQSKSDEAIASTSREISETNSTIARNEQDHLGLLAEQNDKHIAIGARAAYLAGAVHLMERHFSGTLQMLAHQVVPSGSSEKGEAPSSSMASTLSEEIQTILLDSFYLAFENKFRGSRELIKERLLQYGPLLSEVKQRLADPAGVDVGCGRGEWLEVLQEHGIQASGVDMNQRMKEQCLSLGLKVECDDAIAYLKRLPENSFAVVSGFHIVEHLELGLLLELIQQSHRVLRPGGVAIFETPNPEVLKVSTYTFYFDPTHRNPLPSELLSFMGRNAGFSESRVARFQPVIENGGDPQYLDYACIFTK